MYQQLEHMLLDFNLHLTIDGIDKVSHIKDFQDHLNKVDDNE